MFDVRTYVSTDPSAPENAKAVAVAFDRAGKLQPGCCVLGPTPAWAAARLRERLAEEAAQAEAQRRSMARTMVRARAAAAASKRA